MRSRRRYDPFRELISEIRTAAAQINTPQARQVAAREADRIPLTQTERAHGAKAKIAGLARAQMRALPNLSPDKYADAVSVLRGCADALTSRFEVTSEVQLGRSRRSNHQAA